MRTQVIEIEDAKYLNGFVLKLFFSDKTMRVINLEQFLRNAKNPMTIQYLDKTKFKNFRIVYGDLVWGDYELCFPVWDLHEGKI
jgi:hypothetical protein